MNSDGSSSTFQTLAGALAGGLSAYYDSQNTQPVYVTQPSPQTAYGLAGTGQNAPGTVGGLSPTVLLVLAVVAVAFFALKK